MALKKINREAHNQLIEELSCLEYSDEIFDMDVYFSRPNIIKIVEKSLIRLKAKDYNTDELDTFYENIKNKTLLN